jgi:N-acetylmuramoyl-L-alanine amidase
MVLKNIEAPAVLLEAGVIVNRNEEVELSSRERETLISEAVLAATNQFCGEEQEARAHDKR